MVNELIILIGGDFVPTKSNFELFRSANTSELFGDDLLDVLRQADFRVFNLEVPLTDKEAPIKKCGPNLVAPTSTINGIKQIQTDLLTLANNHILDHGTQGLYSTINVLNENGINYVGAGANLKDAACPYVFERNGLCIGIYACAEHEFSIATEKTAGANPFDPLESLDHISDLKRNCDFVIVLFHGGKEHYRYPSPYLQKVCRKIVDKGAKLVVCQHSHCIGAAENYNGGMIVYGQGNFLFDHSESDFWKTSLLIRASVSDQGMSVDYIPILKTANVVRLADEQSASEIMESFIFRSKMIMDNAFVRKQYEEFAMQMLNGYLVKFHGNNILFRVLNKLCGHKLVAKLYSDKSLTAIQNYIECEAHRELFLQGVSGKQNK